MIEERILTVRWWWLLLFGEIELFAQELILKRVIMCMYTW